MHVEAYTGPDCSMSVRFLVFITIKNEGFDVESPKHWLPLPPQEIFVVLIAVRS